MGLYVVGDWTGHGDIFTYLPWNLLLAWLALAVALWLEAVLNRALWSSWYALFVTLVWAVSLPNAFYMVSDFTHLRDIVRVDFMYDLVLFCSFIFNGIILGYASLFVVHRQLAKRLHPRSAFVLVELVLLLCSFAIYIGRELRWNTWDIVAHPAQLLVDVSDRVINPAAHPDATTLTFGLFVLLSTTYITIWYAARAVRQTAHKTKAAAEK